MTREEIESALDTHKLYIAMNNGRYWKARRNGKTQTWKTRPTHFKIPIKFGFKLHGYITHENMHWDQCWRIGDETV